MTTNPGLFIQTQFIPGIIISHSEFVTNISEYFSLWHSILSESQQINIDLCSYEAQRSVQALWAFSSPDGWMDEMSIFPLSFSRENIFIPFSSRRFPFYLMQINLSWCFEEDLTSVTLEITVIMWCSRRNIQSFIRVWEQKWRWRFFILYTLRWKGSFRHFIYGSF